MEHTLTPTPATQLCPDCQASIPVYQGFVAWCAACNWNVHPSQAANPRNRLDVFYDHLGQRLSEGLFRELGGRAELKRHVTVSSGLALGLATLTHLVTLVFLGLGFALVFNGWPHLLLVVGGMICFGIAWVVRPRICSWWWAG